MWLTEAKSQQGEKDALAKGSPDYFSFQGTLCPSRPLHFWASGLSCLIFRDLQASPCPSSSSPLRASLACRRVQSHQQPGDRMGVSLCSLLPALFETSAFQDVSLPKPRHIPFPRPGSLTRRAPELPGASGNDGWGVLYPPARLEPTQDGIHVPISSSTFQMVPLPQHSASLSSPPFLQAQWGFFLDTTSQN